MNQEDRDRLIRVETKLDLVLPKIILVDRLDKDVSFIKRMGTLFIAICGIVATYFGSKN